ncbi:hypothetical protein CcI49_28900 [Frankia sp. CcI49]|nr:hypothetical protein CcI49_28900 [Frankia sp. CcI49]
MAATAGLERPALWGIGRYQVGDTVTEFPVSLADLERDTAWAVGVLAACDVGPGTLVHFVCGGWEYPWFAPLHRAVSRLGATYSCADAWSFDARRTEYFIRELAPAVVMGVTGETLDGLESTGLVSCLEAVPRLFSRPDAVRRLAAAGIRSGTIAQVGPLTAVGPAGHAWLAYDSDEWSVGVRGGSDELTVTTVGDRAHMVSGAPLGLAGELGAAPGQVRLV